MCTVIVLHRPDHVWPVVLAANRDELMDRAWDMPAAHWPDQPDVIAGRDRTAGGTWMGINRHGVVAAVLNRQGSLGPATDKRSRGELPLAALAHPTASQATTSMTTLDAGQWRSFNMVLADRTGAWFVRGVGHGRPHAEKLPEGLSMVTAYDPNDCASPRVKRHVPRFRAARTPEPGDWGDWPALIADQTGSASEQLNVPPRGLFATVSSSLLALPARGDPVWLFAAGPPNTAKFVPLW